MKILHAEYIIENKIALYRWRAYFDTQYIEWKMFLNHQKLHQQVLNTNYDKNKFLYLKLFISNTNINGHVYFYTLINLKSLHPA